MFRARPLFRYSSDAAREFSLVLGHDRSLVQAERWQQWDEGGGSSRQQAKQDAVRVQSVGAYRAGCECIASGRFAAKVELRGELRYKAAERVAEGKQKRERKREMKRRR